MLSLNCFAADEELIDEGYIYDPATGSYYLPEEVTYDDSQTIATVEGDAYMLEEGWIYDAQTDSYNMPYYLSNAGTMPLLLSEPNFEFDPNDIAWSEMPSNIQDIVYASVPNMSSDDFNGKVPFLCVGRTGSYIRIFAGWNISFGVVLSYNASTSTSVVQDIGLFSFPNFNSYSESVLYSADFNLDLNPITSWNLLTPTAYGSTGNAMRYGGLGITSSAVCDIYCYGANFGKPGNISSFTVYLTPSNSDGTLINHYFLRVVTNPSVGFAGGSIIGFTSDFPNSYFSYFSPKTPEQVAAETSKGIWDTLKSIPEMIGEKLKSLFIPEDGYFDSYIQDFQTYFSERFGLLYELPEAIINILQQFISFTPTEDDYSINFPEVVMPVLDNGEWYDKVIIDQTVVNFGFLNEGAFNTLYTMYRSLIWLIFVFALINLIIRKANKVFGG